MKRRRHTPEQVVRKLQEADRLLGEGFWNDSRGQAIRHRGVEQPAAPSRSAYANARLCTPAREPRSRRNPGPAYRG